jgi:methionyl aminopeptidase
MIELKSPGEVDAVAAAGAVVGSVLAAVGEHATPGVTPRELDALADDLMTAAGATSSFRGYHPGWAPGPYPAVIIVSVNDAVVHGIPDDRPLRDGDLISVDFAVHLDGWCADAAFSKVVGRADPADTALVQTTERALAAGIAAAQPGARMGDIAHAIGRVGRAGGYGLLADHGGHGVGRSMHEDPHVPNEGRAGRGLVLRPGLVLALEPMLIAGGTDRYRHDPDGWTIRTVDGSRAAHAEHTIAVTESGPRVLTAGRPCGELAVAAARGSAAVR